MSETMNVRRIAALAKIRNSPDEEVRLSAEMEDILAFARQLQQLDLTDVPQTQHILDRSNVLRDDVIGDSSLPQEAVLAASPSRDEAYITVPRTVE